MPSTWFLFQKLRSSGTHDSSEERTALTNTHDQGLIGCGLDSKRFGSTGIPGLASHEKPRDSNIP